MAKKSVTNKEYRRMLSARQERQGGRFGPVKPQFRTAAPSPVATPTAAAEAPPQGDPVEAAQEQVGLLEALLKERAARGFETSNLENIVLGLEGSRGLRSELQDFINKNAGKFNMEDPAGAAAFTLMKEAVTLSEASLKASDEEAKVIYAKLNFIRELAKKTQGKQSDIANKLNEVIGPVEEQLKKRTSFGEFIKEKVKDFRKTLPERIVSKIPVVGGILGQFMRQKREAQEELEKYSGGLQEKISRGGRLSEGLDLPGMRRRPRPEMERMGGTRASDIPGMLEGVAGAGGAATATTLGSIHKEVVAIRKLLTDKFEPSGDELRARESELEGITRTTAARPQGRREGTGILSGFLSSIMKMFGGGGEGGGIGSTVMDIVSSMPGSKMLGRAGRAIGRGLGSVGGFAMRGLGRAGRAATGFLKTTSLGKDLSAIGKTASNIGKGAMNVARSTGGKLLETGAKAGGFLSRAFGSVTGAISNLNPVKAIGSAISSGSGKIVKSIVSLPGIGAVISGLMGALDIASIKKNPELSPDEKKEQIGRTLVGTVGEALGSIGGGALGSLIPIPGIGTLVGTLGGAWVGGKIAELLADQLGGKAFYDMVSSIPGIGSLIEVGGTEDQKAEKSAEASTKAVSGAVSSAGTEGQSAATEVKGTVSAPATANTTVGKMVQQYNGEMNALEAAKRETTGTATASPVVNNSAVNTRVSNVTNNFNDDLRIRNSEPTLKTMQMASHTF